MNIENLIYLLQRELDRLSQEITLFSNEENLWKTKDGVSNSAGNLCLHLIGNLNQYIGADMGNSGYVRDREAEFSSKDISREILLAKISETKTIVGKVLSALQSDDLNKDSKKHMLPEGSSVEMFLLHLLGHINYHLGQINYLRRIIG
jgi:uncharacterized damage-inducible protein DinB